jgi:DNA-binding LytR/AlgR family response regulator
MYFLFSSLIILTGVLVVVISRVIMYRFARSRNLFVWQYVLWVLAEILAMSLFYTLFDVLVLHNNGHVEALFKQTTIKTGLTLLLPYTTIWLYFSWKENSRKLEKLSHEEISGDSTGKGMINFLDEKNELKFSVHSDQLLWLEAADNYVKIIYLNKGKTTSFMIRNSLKTMEERFSNTAMVRCNRSVIVNFDKVKMLRKDKDGIFLGLNQENIPDIPVSKTYADRVLMHFSHYSL